MLKDPTHQRWLMLKDLPPIVIFSAGSIVRVSYISVYRAAVRPISGGYDPDI